MTTVSLRRVTPDDTDLIYAWRSEPTIAVNQPLLPLPRADIHSMIVQRSHASIGPQSHGDFQWLILSGNTPVGWISLKIAPQDRLHGKGNIGYAISEAHRQRGYGAGGVAALLPIAFGRNGFDLDRLEAVAAVGNMASRRVLESNGFRFEGVQRGLLVIRGERIDHVMYGLLRTDLSEYQGRD
jgi:RimJ/RimL family protein N-acetyltransferase